jgi:hypothetical protein
MNTTNHTNNADITISIERVILDGLPVAAHQRGKLQAAFEAELARLLANGELAFDLQTGGLRKQVPAGVLELKADETIDTLGKKLAQAIYRGIGQ